MNFKNIIINNIISVYQFFDNKNAVVLINSNRTNKIKNSAIVHLKLFNKINLKVFYGSLPCIVENPVRVCGYYFPPNNMIHECK